MKPLSTGCLSSPVTACLSSGKESGLVTVVQDVLQKWESSRRLAWSLRQVRRWPFIICWNWGKTNAEFHTPCFISEYTVSCIQLFNLGLLKDSGTDKIVCGNSEVRTVTFALTTSPPTENSSCTSLTTREAFLHCALSCTLYSHETILALRASGCENSNVAQLILWGKI